MEHRVDTFEPLLNAKSYENVDAVVDGGSKISAATGGRQEQKMNWRLELMKRVNDVVPSFTDIFDEVQCIPQLMSHHDVVVEAPTGSGKTLAYLLPMAQILARKNLSKYEVGALILVPNRELAAQIFGVLHQFSSVCKFTSCSFVGGNKIANDVENFYKNGANILVATPGRLEEAMDKGKTLFCQSKASSPVDFLQCFKSLEVLILDEADRLFEVSFERSLTTILEHVPKQKRTGLFSATQTTFEDQLKKVGLRNAVYITVKADHQVVTKTTSEEESRVPTTLKNYYTVVNAQDKFTALCQFLKLNPGRKILLFVSTCACADYLGRLLTRFLSVHKRPTKKKAKNNKRKNKAVSKNATQVLILHGKKKSKRQKVLERFRNAKTSCVMVCTDVMARGLDVPDIDWVVQYDVPRGVNFFLHRCGRTARCGRSGNALLFLLPSEVEYVGFLAKNQQVQLELYADFPAIEKERVLQTFDKIRNLSASDRILLIKGTMAFVSFIQAYSKHDCSIVCQLKDLDVVNVAHNYGLHRLPKMPELCDRDLSSFKRSSINTSQIKFNDKQRENERLKKKEESEKIFLAKKGGGVKMGRRGGEKKHDDNNDDHAQRNESPVINDKPGNKRSRRRTDENDVEDDYKLLKKLKKGRISGQQFDDKFLNA